MRPGVHMADSGGSGLDETARLEAALARIARARQPEGGVAAGANGTVLAARLDALIAEIRSVLGRDSAD